MEQLKGFLALTSIVGAFIAFVLFVLMLQNDQVSLWMPAVSAIFIALTMMFRRSSQHSR